MADGRRNSVVFQYHPTVLHPASIAVENGRSVPERKEVRGARKVQWTDEHTGQARPGTKGGQTELKGAPSLDAFLEV